MLAEEVIEAKVFQEDKFSSAMNPRFSRKGLRSIWRFFIVLEGAISVQWGEDRLQEVK